MSRKQHTHHYIYRITCSVTGRYYIGMHSTSNLEDNYLGSGTQLWRSKHKHGKHTHAKEILEFLPDRKALAVREREIVNESLIADPLCMNLMKGGEGGGFLNTEHQLKCSSAGGKVNTPLKKEKAIARMSAENKKRMENGTFKLSLIHI